MSPHRKVVWNEGMLLTPHHFQQWDNYYDDLLNSRTASLVPYEWGILDLLLNHEAIANGLCEIVRCRAVMPDGLMVNVPQTDVAPEARHVDGFFQENEGSLAVYLAIPSKRAGARNFQGSGGEHSPTIRYWQDAAVVLDETTGQNEQQLAFARSNLRLMFASELRDGYNSIKIAEIVRTPTGQLSYVETYVPPALSISSSVWLVNMLRQIVEVLIAKSSSLGEQRRQRTTSLADFTTSEIAVFWLLNTVNSSLPVLMHLFRTRLVHPERLYTEMAELCGRLMTFATDRHPQNIVHYLHTDLYGTFSALALEIRSLMETVIPTRCVQIPLETTRESVYVGRVQDDRLLTDAEFFLGVHAKVPEGQLIERVPRIIKIASRDVIDGVIGSGLPGVTLTHASPPPSPIPTRIGFHYFNLDKDGIFWESIRNSKSVAIYVPQELVDQKLELYAIKP
ncbi:MAG: type secretion system protein ImpJ [Blastocatellia bacterium]|jgi:type VI secretion system protein ImpJ|nr:type secretion system protein ImpJ [Blastocatellia bacterium]